MAFYGSEELAKKLVQKEIDVKEDFVRKCPEMIEIVRKFDGKVLNKRLETALRNVYYVTLKHDDVFGWWELIGYANDRMVQEDELDQCGHRGCAYIKDDRFYIATCKKDLTDDDGRLIADKLIEYIEDEAKRQQTYANQLRNQLDHIDDLKAEAARIRRMKQDFVWKVNSQIKEYFGLEV